MSHEEAEKLANQNQPSNPQVETIDNNNRHGTLSNEDARRWYLEQETRISSIIDKSLSPKEQAKQAFDFRNEIKTEARNLMSNREDATSLDRTDPNLTWEEVVQKQIDKGYTGDDIYLQIIESSQRSRTSVNESLGIE